MAGDIFQTLENMKNFPVKQTNLQRAKDFRIYTIAMLIADGLSLIPITDETKRRRLLDIGGPLYDIGEMAHGMKTKNNGNDGEAGYYSNDTENHSNSNITNHDIAVIHSTHPTKPRPFLLNSAIRFENEKDDAIIDKAFDDFWSRV